MCQIAISKSTEQVFFLTVVTVVKKIMEPLQKKIRQAPIIYIFFFLFSLGNFGKSNLTHLTTDVMFSGQQFAILAMFLYVTVYMDVSLGTGY